jgi:hypothetical protein
MEAVTGKTARSRQAACQDEASMRGLPITPGRRSPQGSPVHRRRSGRSLVAAILLGLLAGCSTSGVAGLLTGGKVRGDAETVLVLDFHDAASALPFAVLHCSRYQRSAQFERRTAKGVRFRCVS